MHQKSYRELFVGLDAQTPVFTTDPNHPAESNYINLDNAASTPSLKIVHSTINEYLPYYSSVHRGSGFKSQLSTHIFEEARTGVMKFVNANENQHICVFTKNTSESINKLAKRFPYTEARDVVLTVMEHHSNDLPWRHFSPKTVHVKSLPDGRLDMQDLKEKLKFYNNRIALVSVTAASNVTGVLNPIHDIAELVHSVGGKIVVDCAQLIAHRRVDMLDLTDPRNLDFIAFSAHKIYAPFGSGCLIGRKDCFDQGIPDMVGGGTIQVVTLDRVMWAAAPDRDEAGSPNVIGAVALLAAVREMEKIGMDKVEAHETMLTEYALNAMKKVKGIRLFGPNDGKARVGCIPFDIKGIAYGKIAAILGNEFGIGVRAGCFCAQPYLLYLLDKPKEITYALIEEIKQGELRNKPGLIRASFGLYNTTKDIDNLVDALQKIVKGQYNGEYIQSKVTGDYEIQNWEMTMDKYFTLPLEGTNASPISMSSTTINVNHEPNKKAPPETKCNRAMNLIKRSSNIFNLTKKQKNKLETP